MSASATLDRILRCVVPACAPGMSRAMATLTGAPSMVSQPVTPESSLTTMTAASVMASDLACGMAKPSIMPVVPSASRARKAFITASASPAIPALTAWLDTKLRASSREAKSSATKTFSTFTKSAASALGASTAAALGASTDLAAAAAGATFWFFSKSYFLKATNRMPPTTAPMRIARTHSGPFSTTGRTRKPPWGAGS